MSVRRSVAFVPLAAPAERWDRAGRRIASSLVQFGGSGAVTFDLVCFPAAGEPASRFNPWRAWLPPTVGVVGVERAGRGRRWGEPPTSDLTNVAREVAEDLRILRGPYVLVGHSAGTLVAHAVAVALREAGGADPSMLIACNGRSPSIDRPIRWWQASNEELLAELRAMHASAGWRLDEAYLVDQVLPALRADLALYERAPSEVSLTLDVPIVALGGTEDELVPPADVHRWREVAAGPYRTVITDHGHFAPVEDPGRYLAVLARMTSLT